MKHVFSIILFLVIVLSAAFVDKDRAQKVAENYYKNRCSEMTAKTGANVVKVIENLYMGEVTRYTVGFEQGFVIVTADDRLRPILGYSDHGKAPDPSKSGGENFKEWFQKLDMQIGCSKSSKYIDEEAVQQWKDIENNVFPKNSKSIIVDRLIETKWGQERPWNNSCPVKEERSTYAGCIATSGAMILTYHNWPSSGVGSNTYNWFNGTDAISMYENFANYTFDYSLMQNEFIIEYGLYPEYWESYNCSQQEIDEMAKITYLFGISVGMNYGNIEDGMSTSTMTECLDAYNNNWGYTATRYDIGTVTDPAVYSNMIQSELNAKRPWQWAGGVHSFILDGYTDDYWYHFNWGWEGLADGWFQLTSLVPLDVGSCGFDTDFTSSQVAISVVPNADTFASWPAPETFLGQILNGEDVQLTWTKPSTGDPIGYNIYRTLNYGYGQISETELIANTTSLFFTDYSLAPETHIYSLKAVYSDGESHFTNTYNAIIQELEEFPIAYDLSAIPVGRTSIDIEWAIPFVGVIYCSENFESGSISADWVQKTSENLKGDAKPVRQFFYEDELDEISLLDSYDAPNIVTHGEYACIFSTSAERNLWLFSPEFTYNADALIKFWTRFKYGGGPIGNENVIFNIVAYTGNFDEQSGATYDVIGRWDSAVDSENEWESEWEVSLATLDGQTKRVGFMVEANANDYYTFAIDDIIIGSTSGGPAADPIGYEVYRNNILATTINDGEINFWSDTDFIDGDNEYFVRVIFPTGQSISSEKVIAFMDANPKPDYLTGIFNGNDVDLSWYIPYGTPSHWATLVAPENCTTTVDYLDDTDCAKRRAEFTAEAVGLYYPVTIDSIAGGFYEWDDEAWNGDTFIIRLWEGHPYDGSGTLLYESGTLTATPGEIYAVDCGTQVLNGEWNVEVEALDAVTGHPATLAGPSTGGINCYFFYTYEDSYNYYVTSGDTPLSYCLMAYCTGSDPTDPFKSVWTSSDLAYTAKPKIDNSGRLIGTSVVDTKAIDTYNIYRNDSVIGTSSTTSYTDNSLVYGTYTYYVTANYVNPAGESEQSNEVTIFPPPGPEPFYTSIELEITGSLITISWEALTLATGYDVYSGSDPYGTFTFVGSTSELFLETTVFGDKRFYYVVGTIDRKEPLKEIKVKESDIKR
ncbi:MAG: C10 family peptidase [Candidatus Delongbacteria bacterium]|nr:C10 family peptidase [Candidatus Delongbacteria bacterium]